MNGYKLPFEITNEILSLVASISEKIGKLSVTSDLINKQHLRKNSKIKSVHSSLKIEANSLTLGQVQDVIDGKLVMGGRKKKFRKLRMRSKLMNSSLRLILIVYNRLKSSIIL